VLLAIQRLDKIINKSIKWGNLLAQEFTNRRYARDRNEDSCLYDVVVAA